MCSPQPQPAGMSKMDLRRLPQCWFLAEIVSDLPAYGWNVSGHVYISRTEDGLYRVLRYGRAWLVSEGVAKRHFARVLDKGVPVRVSQQQKWNDVWNEAMAEARRQTAA